MLSALRALFAAMPAILVLSGIVLMSRDPELGARGESEVEQDETTTVQFPTPEDEARMHRVALKQEIATDMLTGLLTVDEATARFLELSSSDPESLEHLRQLTIGRTDEEKALHQLLGFARVQANRNPERFARALAEAETLARSRDTSLAPQDGSNRLD